jgi:multicomponent Na+:H+ antiporter subunit D
VRISYHAAGAQFDYLHTATLVTVAAELIVGIGLLIPTIRRGGVQSGVGWLRRPHTGSVNDYTAFATVGIIVVSCVLLP